MLLTKLTVGFCYIFLNSNLGVTIYEQFMFCFNTVLSDIAVHFPHTRDDIVNAQLEVLDYLVEKVIRFDKTAGSKAKTDHEEVCIIEPDKISADEKGCFFNDDLLKFYNLEDVMKILCMIIGLMRSIGRFSVDLSFPLISYIYPLPFHLPDTPVASSTKTYK